MLINPLSGYIMKYLFNSTFGYMVGMVVLYLVAWWMMIAKCLPLSITELTGILAMLTILCGFGLVNYRETNRTKTIHSIDALKNFIDNENLSSAITVVLRYRADSSSLIEQEYKDARSYMCNYFENIGAQIKMGFHNNTMIKNMMCNTVVKTYEAFSKETDARRVSANNPEIYKNFEWLYDEWKK